MQQIPRFRLACLQLFCFAPHFTPSLTFFYVDNWQMMKKFEYLGVELMHRIRSTSHPYWYAVRL